MDPCRAGYPCIYASKDGAHCALPECVLRHVTIEGREGEFAYDRLTGHVTKWVAVKRSPVQDVDPRDAWFAEFSRRQLAMEIQSADTYERKRGRVRQKRQAVR